MSPSGSRMQAAGTSTSDSPFWRRASRSSAAGRNTDGNDRFLLSSSGGIDQRSRSKTPLWEFGADTSIQHATGETAEELQPDHPIQAIFKGQVQKIVGQCDALVPVEIREHHLLSLSGAGTKSGDDVVALWGEEVAVERTREPGAGGEASTAQHLARVEPRLRVIRVGIGSEARKRHEVGRRPFPHIPDHLPASEGAVARGARGDVERAIEGKTEIGPLGARRRLAPRPAALDVGQTQAGRARLAHGGSLPFGLGGQPALSPVAIGLRLVPVDEGYRGVRR